MSHFYSYLFGPVHSRRFGRSLGVDLLPTGKKTCMLDCVFCELGRTPSKRIAPCENGAPLPEVIGELERWVAAGGQTDFITLGGSGEPTLHPRFGEILDWIRQNTPFRSLLLSNGTLFQDPKVREQAIRADVVKFSLHGGTAERYNQIARPDKRLCFDKIIEGVRTLRGEYAGELVCEVFLVPGMNDDEENLRSVAAILETIRPDRIHLNTAARPTADANIRTLSPERLEELADLFTPRAEIPANGIRPYLPRAVHGELADRVAALVKRHHSKAEDVAKTLGASPDAIRPIFHMLAAEGRVSVTCENGSFLAGPPNGAKARPVPLILASASPRRAKILKDAGYEFEILKTSAPEIARDDDPAGTVVHNAVAKLRAARAERPDAIVLAADTLVWFKGKLLGKPADLAEAASMLRSYSGKTQTVFTGVAAGYPDDPAPRIRVEASIVRFKELTEETITRYLELVNPLDRAGAYDIGEHGEMLIESTEGSATNVEGLPREVLRDLLG